MASDYPPDGEDSLVSVDRRIRPIRQRGYTAPRGALYALRVASKALRQKLPLPDPSVLGAARAHRSEIRKIPHSMPYTWWENPTPYSERDHFFWPTGIRVSFIINDHRHITTGRCPAGRRNRQNEYVVFGAFQMAKSNPDLFYWDPPRRSTEFPEAERADT